MEIPGSTPEAMGKVMLKERARGGLWSFRRRHNANKGLRKEKTEEQVWIRDLISPATGWMPTKGEAGRGKSGEQRPALTTSSLDGWKSWFEERSPESNRRASALPVTMGSKEMLIV